MPTVHLCVDNGVKGWRGVLLVRGYDDGGGGRGGQQVEWLFVTKFISLAQVVPSPVYPYSAESWPKTLQSFHFVLRWWCHITLYIYVLIMQWRSGKVVFADDMRWRWCHSVAAVIEEHIRCIPAQQITASHALLPYNVQKQLIFCKIEQWKGQLFVLLVIWLYWR